MTFSLLHLSLLAGLAGLTIPVVIHLWNRRNAPVVDWGAMMFLELQPAHRRRLLLEDLLLLLVRLGIVAALVFAVAGPIVRGPAVAAWTRPPRDVVFVLDTAARLARRDVSPPPWDRALDALADEIGTLAPGDRWTIVTAGEPPRSLFDGLQRADAPFDPDVLGNRVVPAGNSGGPAALTLALKILDEQSQSPHREIVVLTDGLRSGWADDAALAEWERLSPRWAEPKTSLRIRFAPPDLPATPPNYHLGRPDASRRTIGIGQRVRWQARASADHLKPAPPPANVRLIVDDETVLQQKIDGWNDDSGRGDIRFEHVFAKPGPHRVRIELTPPSDADDALVLDNAREFVVPVVSDVPVLVVEGADTLTPNSPAYFLMQAFGGSIDPLRPALVSPRRVSAATFGPKDLNDVRAVVLADVPSLNTAQAEAIERFLRAGGGVLVALGTRVRADAYRDYEERTGRGWLPCRIDEIVQSPKPIGVQPAPLAHPALHLFTKDGKSSLDGVRVSGHWRLSTSPSASTLALFEDGDPWLIEKSVGAGRVVVSAVPFDRAWGDTLTASWEFPVFAHEFIFALADGSTPPLTLKPGEPLRVGPGLFAPPWKNPVLPLAGKIERLGGPSQPALVPTWPATLEAPGPVGSYRLTLGDREPLPIVVDDDVDNDFAPISGADKARLERLAPIAWNASDASPADDGEANLTRVLFLAGLVLLCLEMALARRASGAPA